MQRLELRTAPNRFCLLLGSPRTPHKRRAMAGRMAVKTLRLTGHCFTVDTDHKTTGSGGRYSLARISRVRAALSCRT